MCVCSDCVLVSSDGEKFHAHKLVLCAQSGVFKSMLESEHWVHSRQGNQVGCLGWGWMTRYSISAIPSYTNIHTTTDIVRL